MSDHGKASKGDVDGALSYEELEAQAAAMRGALEGVWAVCSREMWPKVGRALEPPAGKELLERLAKMRRERNLLRDPVRILADIFDDNEQRKRLWTGFINPYDLEDDDYLEVRIELSLVRQARDALREVEATPEKIRAMKNALQRIEAYKDYGYGSEGSGARADKDEALRLLRRHIPQDAHQSLEPTGLPRPDDQSPSEWLAEAGRLEDTLRSIAARAESFTDGQPENEIFHALMVEFPTEATKALAKSPGGVPRPAPG